MSNKKIYRRRKRRRLSKRGRYAAIVGIAALVLFITLLVVARNSPAKGREEDSEREDVPGYYL